MLFNTFNPYWWAASPVLNRSLSLPRVDINGIYKLSTNAVSSTETTVDYGINPCLYIKLPNESLVLLTINLDTPEGSDDLPVTVVVPSSSSTASSSSGTTKVNVVDSLGNNITGSNVQSNTLRFVYINKCAGIIRFLEFTNAA